MTGGYTFQYPDARLLIFTKAPVPGQVKSRLVPDLDESAAAQLHRLMTLNVVAMAVDGAICPVELWCYPHSEHSFFQNLQQRFLVELHVQQGADLGERMFQAADYTLQHAKQVVIIGSDCLQYTAAYFAHALRQLSCEQCDVVIAPAHDGGYVLLGMNRIDKRLFQHIAWGSHQVMEQTRDALRQLQWRWQELPTLRDTDVKADLLHIMSHRHQYRPDSEIDNLLQHSISGSPKIR
ncbi:MAG: TIGR04282 family arsenosugar biosynthesis glycosyltransferase [Gammaproteobacteria bacterium]